MVFICRDQKMKLETTYRSDDISNANKSNNYIDEKARDGSIDLGITNDNNYNDEEDAIR